MVRYLKEHMQSEVIFISSILIFIGKNRGNEWQQQGSLGWMQVNEVCF